MFVYLVLVTLVLLVSLVIAFIVKDYRDRARVRRRISAFDDSFSPSGGYYQSRRNDSSSDYSSSSCSDSSSDYSSSSCSDSSSGVPCYSSDCGGSSSCD